jgi:ATP-dependent DNA helicase RecQ
VAYAEQPGCSTRWLLRWFGEEMPANCGHCDGCRKPSSQIRQLSCTGRRCISTEDVALIQMLLQERHPALRNARQLARFLCGISSPATSKAKLTKRNEFGLLAEVPFLQVLAQIESRVG